MSMEQEKRILFDHAADAYDIFRPSYPEPAVDCIISYARVKRSSRVLEVGAGPGKASVLFAARGLTIDCLEPGENLCRLARKNLASWPRVNVIPSTFEDFDGPGEGYDLMYAAQSFHWIDHPLRFRKAQRLLSRHGSLAIIYNYSPAPEKGLSQDLHRAIHASSGGAMKSGNYEDEIARWTSQIKADDLFFDLQVERFRWRSEYTAQRYAGLLSTYSTFLALEKATQERILAAVADVFAAHRRPLVRDMICVVFLARKNRRRASE